LSSRKEQFLPAVVCWYETPKNRNRNIKFIALFDTVRPIRVEIAAGVGFMSRPPGPYL
jgi:hypothetical protein